MLKLNWAKQQVEAASKYIASITSSKKSMRQFSNAQETFKGQQTCLAHLGDALNAITKCTGNLQAEKWEAKKQVRDSGNIIRALIQVRQTFNSLVSKKQPDLIEETTFDEMKNPHQLLGENHASWMQKLAKESMIAMRYNAF